jgi:hypothetical protein
METAEMVNNFINNCPKMAFPTWKWFQCYQPARARTVISRKIIFYRLPHLLQSVARVLNWSTRRNIARTRKQSIDVWNNRIPAVTLHEQRFKDAVKTLLIIIHNS